MFSSHRRHRGRGRRRRNPSFGATLKSGMNPAFLINAALVSGGLIAGSKTASIMKTLPFVDRLGNFTGLLNVVLGAFGAAYFRSPKLKSVCVGIAAGGLYNTVASNLPQLGVSAMSGEDLLGIDVRGEQRLVPMGGVDVMGEDPVVMMAGEGDSNWGPNWG